VHQDYAWSGGTEHAGFQGESPKLHFTKLFGLNTALQNTIMLNVLLPPIILNSGFELKQVSLSGF